MRQEKRKQKEVFDPDTASLNHPATFATTKRKASSIAESTTPTKKQKKSPDEMLQALKKQFRIYIINELTKSKNKKQTLDTLAARKQMPRVVIDAEDDIDCERSNISYWLRGQKEPNVNLFLTYLRDNKDDIMKELESTTVSSAGPSTATGARPPSPTSSMRSTSTSTSTSTAAASTVGASTVGASTATETFRSCPASLLSIIRPDLETNARTHIITTLLTALTAARDYTVDFSIQISKLVLLFKDHTFELSGKSVAFPSAQGPKINTLLPERFIGNTDHLPPPLPEKVLKSKMYRESLDQLFTLQHLARVHSAYYSAIGSQTTSPYQDALFHVLPKTDDNAARREKKPPTVSQAPTTDFSFGSKSKGTVDKLIKKEQKTLEKHNKKGRDDCVAKYQARVDLYIKAREDQREQRFQAHQDLLAGHKAPTTAATAVTTSQSRDIAVVDPNEEIPVDESIDKSRINDLKTLLKKLLLQDKVASQKYISSQFPGIKDNEMKVITKIIKVIHPYIHLKGKSQFIYKLPLILLANQVLSALGKNRATTPITPKPSCHKLQALFVDTETLFSLFVSSRSDRVMNISTLSNDPIKSASKALDHKNAVFGSFFDIRAIHKICQSYNMEFANILHLLPGGKTFTIVGTRSLPPSSNVPPPSDQHPTTHGLPLDDERRAILLKAEKEASQRQLEQHRQDLSDFHRSTSIRQLKKDFTHTIEAKDAIKIAKEKNRQLEFAVAEDRRAVQLKKQEIQALSWVAPTHQPKFVQSDSCYQRAEDSLLHSEDIQHSTFCGTDNGLVSITETMAFSIDEFNYYINLHNHAHNLDSSNGTLVFHPPPKSFKVNPKIALIGVG